MEKLVEHDGGPGIGGEQNSLAKRKKEDKLGLSSAKLRLSCAS